LSILTDLRARHIPAHLWYSSGGHAAGADFPADQRAKEAAMLDWMDEFLRGADHGFRASDAHARPLVDYWERVAPGEPGRWEHHTASTWLGGARAARFSVGTGAITNDLGSANFAHDSISKEIFERTLHGPVGVMEAMPESQNPIDTMHWSSGPLASALHVVGPTHVHLPVSTTARAVAQVSAKLWDVSAGGAQLIARGCRSFESPRGPFDFDLWPNAHTFAAGHRVELSISAVDFPTFEPDREPQRTTILPGARLDLPLAR
jgi:predicted acyl esterase